MSLATYQDLVDRTVRDEEERITEQDRDRAIQMAVTRFSKDRPRVKVEDLTSTDGRYIDLPASWVDESSSVRSLEYPIGDFPPTYIQDSLWQLYSTPNTEKLLLISAITASATVRVNYTIPHTLSDSENTIPDRSKEPVASYAASLLCDQLASFYTGETDSTVSADNVDHQGKGALFAARAKVLRDRYYNEMGIDPKRNVASGCVVDLDLTDWRGRDLLTHPGRLR